MYGCQKFWTRSFYLTLQLGHYIVNRLLGVHPDPEAPDPTRVIQKRCGQDLPLF